MFHVKLEPCVKRCHSLDSHDVWLQLVLACFAWFILCFIHTVQTFIMATVEEAFEEICKVSDVEESYSSSDPD